MLNKTLEAWLRGYFCFRVITNDCMQTFLTYNAARKARLEITTGSVRFEGYHIWKKWICFYQRLEIK